MHAAGEAGGNWLGEGVVRAGERGQQEWNEGTPERDAEYDSAGPQDQQMVLPCGARAAGEGCQEVQ